MITFCIQLYKTGCFEFLTSTKFTIFKEMINYQLTFCISSLAVVRVKQMYILSINIHSCSKVFEKHWGWFLYFWCRLKHLGLISKGEYELRDYYFSMNWEIIISASISRYLHLDLIHRLENSSFCLNPHIFHVSKSIGTCSGWYVLLLRCVLWHWSHQLKALNVHAQFQIWVLPV